MIASNIFADTEERKDPPPNNNKIKIIGRGRWRGGGRGGGGGETVSMLERISHILLVVNIE